LRLNNPEPGKEGQTVSWRAPDEDFSENERFLSYRIDPGSSVAHYAFPYDSKGLYLSFSVESGPTPGDGDLLIHTITAYCLP